ncbi:MAG: ArnT family glycosyltransferase [Microthrixaceae bacterium]
MATSDPAELHPAPPPLGGDLTARTFRVALAGIAAVALAVRVAFVLVRQSSVELVTGDAFWYHFQARLVADGRGFLDPFSFFKDGVQAPGADHPPGFVLVLAALDKMGITTPQGQRLVMCVLGTVSVVLVAYLGRRLAGPRVGLVAAGFAALYPNFWINDGMLMVETVYILASVVALIAGYRYLDRPRWGEVVLMSAALTAGAMVRPEALLLFGLMVLPVVLWRRAVSWPVRIGQLAVAALVPLIAFAPWAAYNQSRYGQFVPVSTGAGQTLAAANCDVTYQGDFLGYYSTKCLLPPEITPPTATNRAERDRQYNEKATAYMRENAGDLPKVVAARVARLWHLYRPGQSLGLDGFVEGRSGGPPGTGFVTVREALWSYYVLTPLALVGLWLLHRRRRKVYPLLAQPVLATLVAAMTFGITRYRAGAEITLVVCAAVTVVAGFTWMLGRHAPEGTEPERTEPERTDDAHTEPDRTEPVAGPAT